MQEITVACANLQQETQVNFFLAPTMAEILNKRGGTPNVWRAGQFRHAAELAFQNVNRRAAPSSYTGTFYVTKNHEDPTLRVGYQTASNWGSYNPR